MIGLQNNDAAKGMKALSPELWNMNTLQKRLGNRFDPFNRRAATGEEGSTQTCRPGG